MLSITEPDSCISKAIPLDRLFREYTAGESLSEICAIVAEAYRETCLHECSLLESLHDFDSAEASVCYRLANLDRIRSQSTPIPHMPFLDLAIIFYVSFAEDEWFTTIAVTETLMQSWGISDASWLYTVAHRNTCRLFPARMESMTSLLHSLLPEQEMIDDIPLPLFVLSNSRRMYGSTVILYKGLLKSSAGVLGDDLIIIPSSIHELILLPASACNSAESIKDMVLYANRTVLDADDVLSDAVYYYDRKRDKLKIL